MSVEPQGPALRLIDSIRASSALILELLRTRAELFSVELDLELDRLRGAALLLACALVCLVIAIALTVMFVIVVFWDTHRLAAIGASGATLLLAAVALALASRRRMSRRPGPFAATLQELGEDSRVLRGEARR